MREAAERRQQLDEEHEQALAALTTKQQKILLLHKDKVRDLEQKCRSQTKPFGHLSKSLEDFRLEVDIFSTDSFSKQKTPLSLENKLSQILNGLAVKAGKGETSHTLHPGPELDHQVHQPADRKHSFLHRNLVVYLVEHINMLNSPSSLLLCSYNPYDGPNEHPEAELPLVAGKYLYVYGTMDDDGFYQGELLDGQRGLVPSNFVEFVQDKEKPSIQLGDGEEDLGSLDHITLGLMGVDGGAPRDGLLGSSNPLGPCSNGTGPLDPEDLVDDIVPYPRRITLIKQLARSVIVAWEPPMVPLGWGKISCYNVLVDGEVRASVPYGDRTKSLLEKLDLDTYTHRVSVQSVTDRGLSDELRCTLMVGANVVVAPYGLRVDDILRDSAELSWLPSNSNYGHTVFLDGAEHAVVKPGRYRLRFVNLKAMTVYKVRVVARPHQVPWQLLMEQREKKEAAVEFCTQAAGPPLPPQEVQVQCGQAPGVLQVRWKPPILSPSGTSNGASVIGYAVCTKGQKIAEVLYPLADYVTVELNRIQCLEAREVIVRTLSAQGESQDSHVAPIPNNLLLPPPHPAPVPPQQPHPWDPTRSPSAQPPPAPMYGHTLEAPLSANHRSPSPQRILPQPRGTPIPDQMAKAIAREAAQRVAAESGRMERRVVYNEQGQAFHQQNSDEEEEDEEGYGHGLRRQGASVDEFLRGSELGRPAHYSHSEEYHSESSRGSDLSDIMEEDEEELYSEMQLEEGRRRNSHNALKIGNNSSGGRLDRETGRRMPRDGPQPQRHPLMVPSIEGYGDRERRSPPNYDESEPEETFRIFVALFDYDPLSMSPNPDAADEELPFKEGQIIRVYGDKDTDGFYRGEIRGGRMGLLPCNMVSEIRAEDEETMDQLIKQGFLPLNTPVDKDRRGLCQHQATRRMVALYDYDPRESSPNVDVEAELTFCAGDILAVFGEIDEDGFYYGEINGHRALVPSNFLEEVPDDVEVYLTDTPSRYAQDEPANRAEAKRVHRRSQR
uniref:RIMS-binding protein 2 n=1 Tax=Oncorhynchus kisutch TaxID=8019 RepID=A0A8C7M9C3_ONCKI